MHHYQNHPNPVNTRTVNRYSPSVPGYVKLRVFNVAGAEIFPLVDVWQHTGTYDIVWDAREKPSGMYYYRLQTRYGIETRMMLLLK